MTILNTYPTLSDKNIKFPEQDSAPEKSKSEEDFLQFYNKNIKKYDVFVNKERQKSLKKVIIASLIFIITCITFGLILILFDSQLSQMTSKGKDDFFNFQISICSLPIFYIFAICKTFKAEIKSSAFADAFLFFEGFQYNPTGSRKTNNYHQFNLFPDWDDGISKTEDMVTGIHKGVKISFEEILLIKKIRESYYKKFQGLVILLDFNKNFVGRTIVKSDDGRIRNFLNKRKILNGELRRIELEDPEFEDFFEVYGTDQVESRYLLTSSFMERMKHLLKCFESKTVEASFYQNKLLLAFKNNSNLFEPRSIFKKVDLMDDCKKLFKQMNSIFEIIDILKLNQKTNI